MRDYRPAIFVVWLLILAYIIGGCASRRDDGFSPTMTRQIPAYIHNAD